MDLFHVRYSKGQMKIQEMAFVLVGIIIFFAMVSLVYISIRSSNLRQDAQDLSSDSAREMVRKLSSSPEFSWAACDGCVDLDKVSVLKGRKSYSNFWDLDYLAVERVYPSFNSSECSSLSYPDCNKITIINKSLNYGTPSWSFVALCRDSEGYTKCELGKIYASGKLVNG